MDMSVDPFDLPIEGWVRREIFDFLHELAGMKDGWFKPGPICEIGVHHGKFLIAAHNALAGAPALGIDVFDDQARNIDGSGHGSMTSFQSNIEKYALNSSLISFWNTDSLDLTLDDAIRLRDQIGHVNLFSIDGGHTPTHVVNDYRFAEQVVAQNGIILIDDYFNPHWPGVSEGIIQLYTSSYPRFRPFLYLENKLFLCGTSFHARALETVASAMRNFQSRYDVRPVTFHGYSGFSALHI